MPITQHTCPWCTGTIVLNTEENKSSHSVPECKGFQAALNEVSPKRNYSTFTEELDSKGRTVKQ